MNIYKYDIVFQEVPNHISLAFYVCGCPLKCEGCHSPELWSVSQGTKLSWELYRNLLRQYHDKADCILFLGGEWNQAELIEFLKEARAQGYKTALYTGLEDIPKAISENLHFLKTGPWKTALGGLQSPTTNQIFYDLTTQKKLNYLFQTEIKEPL